MNNVLVLETPMAAMFADLIDHRTDEPLTFAEAAMILRKLGWQCEEIARYADIAIRSVESFQQTDVDNCRSKL